jgi:hypothetical protein
MAVEAESVAAMDFFLGQIGILLVPFHLWVEYEHRQVVVLARRAVVPLKRAEDDPPCMDHSKEKHD